jgi:hypothetical protein
MQLLCRCKPLVNTWQIDCTSLRGYALICGLLANTLTAFVASLGATLRETTWAKLALKLTPRSDLNPVQTEHVRLSSAIRVVSKTDTFSHPASSLPGIGNTGAVRFDIAGAQAVERLSCQGEFLSERSEDRFQARLIRFPRSHAC